MRTSHPVPNRNPFTGTGELPPNNGVGVKLTWREVAVSRRSISSCQQIISAVLKSELLLIGLRPLEGLRSELALPSSPPA